MRSIVYHDGSTSEMKIENSGIDGILFSIIYDYDEHTYAEHSITIEEAKILIEDIKDLIDQAENKSNVQ